MKLQLRIPLYSTKLFYKRLKPNFFLSKSNQSFFSLNQRCMKQQGDTVLNKWLKKEKKSPQKIKNTGFVIAFLKGRKGCCNQSFSKRCCRKLHYECHLQQFETIETNQNHRCVCIELSLCACELFTPPKMVKASPAKNRLRCICEPLFWQLCNHLS